MEGHTLNRTANISKSSFYLCCEGKENRLHFPQNLNRSKEFLHSIYKCMLYIQQCVDGRIYIFLVVCGFVTHSSRMIYFYFMKNKNRAFNSFKRYKALVENELNKKIKVLRSDNGKEFYNKEFDDYLKNSGIIYRKTHLHKMVCPSGLSVL